MQNVFGNTNKHILWLLNLYFTYDIVEQLDSVKVIGSLQWQFRVVKIAINGIVKNDCMTGSHEKFYAYRSVEITTLMQLVAV